MKVVTLARKPLAESTIVKNVVAHGAGAINIDTARITSDPAKRGRFPANLVLEHLPECEMDGAETVDAWYCAPGCPVADLDEQMPEAGAFAPVASRETPKTQDIYGKFKGNGDDGRTFQGDEGGASRFFKQVKR